ncbi:hypothetical protein B0H12DRAFT_1070184 [Mycena haematopus]|nr:hypothetical protein B0H12DRAFT_1070184 [Mycena haematopus]
MSFGFPSGYTSQRFGGSPTVLDSNNDSPTSERIRSVPHAMTENPEECVMATLSDARWQTVLSRAILADTAKHQVLSGRRSYGRRECTTLRVLLPSTIPSINSSCSLHSRLPTRYDTDRAAHTVPTRHGTTRRMRKRWSEADVNARAGAMIRPPKRGAGVENAKPKQRTRASPTSRNSTATLTSRRTPWRSYTHTVVAFRINRIRELSLLRTADGGLCERSCHAKKNVFGFPGVLARRPERVVLLLERGRRVMVMRWTKGRSGRRGRSGQRGRREEGRQRPPLLAFSSSPYPISISTTTTLYSHSHFGCNQVTISGVYEGRTMVTTYQNDSEAGVDERRSESRAYATEPAVKSQLCLRCLDCAYIGRRKDDTVGCKCRVACRRSAVERNEVASRRQRGIALRSGAAGRGRGRARSSGEAWEGEDGAENPAASTKVDRDRVRIREIFGVRMLLASNVAREAGMRMCMRGGSSAEMGRAQARMGVKARSGGGGRCGGGDAEKYRWSLEGGRCDRQPGGARTGHIGELGPLRIDMDDAGVDVTTGTTQNARYSTAFDLPAVRGGESAPDSEKARDKGAERPTMELRTSGIRETECEGEGEVGFAGGRLKMGVSTQNPNISAARRAIALQRTGVNSTIFGREALVGEGLRRDRALWCLMNWRRIEQSSLLAKRAPIVSGAAMAQLGLLLGGPEMRALAAYSRARSWSSTIVKRCGAFTAVPEADRRLESKTLEKAQQ